MQPIFAEVSQCIDEFCDKHLNEEYVLVSRTLAATLCRKRPSPLLKGKPAQWAGATMSDNQPFSFRHWIPDYDDWPNSWMGVREDLEFGRKLLPYFAEFLQALYTEGLARKTFVQYRDNLWLLGGTIISRVSLHDDYQTDPLATLIDAVEMDGILPDHHHRMNQAELRAFSRMCRRFEKHFRQSV